MSWTQTELDTCQEAFYLLRQDVDVPTTATADSDTTLEWLKCKKAYAHAKAEVVAAHGWTWAASSVPDLSQWPGEARNALVYCVARELAIPIAGRVADMQNLDALYRDKLFRAILRDINAFVSSSDPLAKEVLSGIRAYFGAREESIPPGISSLVARVTAVSADVLAEIKASYPWTGVTSQTAWSQLPGLVRAAYVAAVSSSVAVGVGLDAQAAATLEQKKQLLIAQAKKGELDAALAANADPILAQLVPNFRTDDAGLASAYAVYTQRVSAVRISAYEEIERTHNWRWVDSSWTGSTTVETKIAAMDGMTRAAYVALVVRMLAVPCGIAPEAQQVYEQQYQTRLRAARIADLETTPITDAVQKEVLALVRNTFSGDAALPRDMKALTDRIDGLKDMARKEVLSSHDWSFAEADYACDSSETEFPDEIFPYHVTLPKNFLLVSACYGEDGKVTQWKLRGREIHAQRMLSRVVYVRDVTDFSVWNPKAYRAFILRLVADVAKCVASDPKDRTLQEQLYRDALEEAKTCDTRSSNAPDEAWGDNEIADTMLNGYERRQYDDPLFRD